jgi:hypothetical protein
VGYSMSLVSVFGAIGGAVFLAWGLKAFARTHIELADHDQVGSNSFDQ